MLSGDSQTPRGSVASRSPPPGQGDKLHCPLGSSWALEAEGGLKPGFRPCLCDPRKPCPSRVSPVPSQKVAIKKLQPPSPGIRTVSARAQTANVLHRLTPTSLSRLISLPLLPHASRPSHTSPPVVPLVHQAWSCLGASALATTSSWNTLPKWSSAVWLFGSPIPSRSLLKHPPLKTSPKTSPQAATHCPTTSHSPALSPEPSPCPGIVSVAILSPTWSRNLI